MEMAPPKGKYDIINFPDLHILHLVDDILVIAILMFK